MGRVAWWGVGVYVLIGQGDVVVGWCSSRCCPVFGWGDVWVGAAFDEPESLILAQSERWRHA